MKPELVVIFGDWCAKCNMMMPIVEEIALEYRDVLQVTKVEVKDENEDLQENYGIDIVPTFLIQRNGEELGRMSGLIDKKLMVKRIFSVL
ncbi:MAG: thioredoxin family protein [Lachnospiraceae bacterium]|nr:thioredoxin family protein [Lachnospiraceae bacterium]